jgi:transcriptional regulator
VWVNPLFETDALPAVRDLIASQSLATVVAAGPLRATHVPLLLKESEEGLTLVGHVPRADAVAAAVTAQEEVLCIFHGARAYVSPGWYATPGLPTYNFSVAHLGGTIGPLSTDDLRAHLLELAAAEEQRKLPEGGTPWTADPAAEGRIDQLLPAIIGFTVSVTTAQAKIKAGQNRTVADCEGTVEELERSPRDEHREVAAQMRSFLDGRVGAEGLDA